MRMLYQYKYLLGVVVTGVSIALGNSCFGGDEKPATVLDAQVAQAESLWHSGKQREYYTRAAEIAGNIATNSAIKNPNKIAATLFGNLLSKDPKRVEVEVARDDLTVMKKLASYLISNTNASTAECLVNVQLLSMYLGNMRNTKLVPAPLPTGCGPVVSGMNPAVITNPVARAEYEAFIKEDNIVNSRYLELYGIELEMSNAIVNYMIRTFRAPGSSPALLKKCMTEAQLSDTEKKKVLSEIAKKQ